MQDSTDLANKLAMDAARRLHQCALLGFTFERDAQEILSTIPLVELLECVEALRDELKCLEYEGLKISAKKCKSVLDSLDAKLEGKG